MSDFSVRVLQDGQAVGLDRKRSEKWPVRMPVSASYGGVNDLWGVIWTPQSVTSPKFGLTIAGQYNETAGNDWLHVTDVEAYVSYLPAIVPEGGLRGSDLSAGRHAGAVLAYTFRAGDPGAGIQVLLWLRGVYRSYTSYRQQALMLSRRE
ncbi:MAG: hypothetical protein ABI560_14265 [Myxococcales bacterium]